MKKKFKFRLDLVLMAAGIVGLMAVSGLKTRSLEDSVFKLSTADGLISGTGFAVKTPSGKTYTLTNRHVCEAAATNAETNPRRIPLRVIEISQDVDLCLLEAVNGHPGLELSAVDLSPGDEIDIYGFGGGFPLSHTHGEYVGEVPGPFEVYFGFVPGLVTAHVLPGNSGSPVLDRHGHVVGVVFASGISIDFRGLIVSRRQIKNFLEPY